MKTLLIALLMLTCCSLSFADIKTPIDLMAVNDKVLQFVDTRQLTFAEDGTVEEVAPSPDFKQLAFITQQEDETRKLCLISSTGGKITAVITCPSLKPAGNTENMPKELWRPDDALVWSPLAWSPNSQLLALKATQRKLVVDEQGTVRGYSDEQEYVLVLEKNGAFKTAIPVPKEAPLYGNLFFSPDSNLIAGVCEIIPDGEYDIRKVGRGLIVFNVTESIATVPYTARTFSPVIRGWYPDGQSISWKPSSMSDKMQRIWLDGRAEDLDISWDETFDSPDGMFSYEPNAGDPGICLKNLHTGELIQVIRDPDDASRLCDWAPNSRMFTYMHEDTIIDKANSRTGELNTLWFAHVGASRPNAMCIALDCDWSVGVSQDCTRVVYVTQKGRICIAELAWRDPSAQEKLSMGLPLTEQDEKEIMLMNAKEVGVAIQLYWNDYDGDLPPADNFEEVIKDYLRNKNALCRPGTDQVLFKYTPPPGAVKESDIEYTADTVIGEMDAGYGWIVVVYADSHVKVVPKGD